MFASVEAVAGRWTGCCQRLSRDHHTVRGYMCRSLDPSTMAGSASCMWFARDQIGRGCCSGALGRGCLTGRSACRLIANRPLPSWGRISNPEQQRNLSGYRPWGATCPVPSRSRCCLGYGHRGCCCPLRQSTFAHLCRRISDSAGRRPACEMLRPLLVCVCVKR